MHEPEAISRNVSIGGILLIANDSLPPRTRVSLTMDVRGPGSGRRVQLLGEGDVVRVQRLESGVGFAIAIQCQQPINRNGKSSSRYWLRPVSRIRRIIVQLHPEST